MFIELYADGFGLARVLIDERTLLFEFGLLRFDLAGELVVELGLVLLVLGLLGFESLSGLGELKLTIGEILLAILKLGGQRTTLRIGFLESKQLILDVGDDLCDVLLCR